MNDETGTAGGRGESGFSLIELIVTVVIMALAFAVIVGGLGTSILGSDLGRRRASAQTVLRSAAEEVKALPYADCAAGYPLDTVVRPTGFSVTVERVNYWDSSTNTFAESPCTADPGLQLVGLKVSAPGPGAHDVSVMLEIVKRRT